MNNKAISTVEVDGLRMEIHVSTSPELPATPQTLAAALAQHTQRLSDLHDSLTAWLKAVTTEGHR